jgi:hypothetical protein
MLNNVVSTVDIGHAANADKLKDFISAVKPLSNVSVHLVHS